MANITRETRLGGLERQIARLGRRLTHLRRLSLRYSWIRLAAFVASGAAAGLAFLWSGIWAAAAALLLFSPLFGAAVYLHRRVEESITRHELWRETKYANLARARLDWEGIPPTFRFNPDPDHPFESDLDLFGERSLFRVVDTAVTYEGSRRLREWLTAREPDLAETLARQALVRELLPLTLFREKLILRATLAAGTSKSWDADRLQEWLDRHPRAASSRLWLLLGAAFTLVNAALYLAARLGWLPPIWRITFILYLGLFLGRSRETGRLFDEAIALHGVLEQLAGVFHLFERFSFREGSRLRALCAPFQEPARRPSRQLAQLTRVVAAMGARGNPVLWFLLNALLPWDLFLVHQLQRRQAAIAGQVSGWMRVWFRLEALGSLATYAYLNPHTSLPHMLSGAGEAVGPVFRAQAIGHPLLPEAEKVRNDFEVGGLGQVSLITGSNMAGKSVFLKTVGVNLALAQAGGPVDAALLVTIPLRLFSSLQVSDSVTGGLSYFYAEVKRLKALLDALERSRPTPLCFLIDEIFRGTNNRERLTGSRAYVRALAGKRGIGFIATHDLELARLAEEITPVKNYHFRDRVEKGRMTFDYKIRPGPSPTTNALKIMEIEGLPT